MADTEQPGVWSDSPHGPNELLSLLQARAPSDFKGCTKERDCCDTACVVVSFSRCVLSSRASYLRPLEYGMLQHLQQMSNGHGHSQST